MVYRVFMGKPLKHNRDLLQGPFFRRGDPEVIDFLQAAMAGYLSRAETARLLRLRLAKTAEYFSAPC
jgi:hypothetical protein